MLRTALMISVLFCCACSVSTTADFLFINWSMVDDPAGKRVTLAYTNTLDREVCMSVGDWPNKFGKVNQMSETMYLVVKQQRFPIRDFNTGYCVGVECQIRVSPKATIRANIPYEEFGLPEELRYERKSLTYPVTGDFCEP
ncbi:MAG: hypothetical protein KBA31_20605 [Alphaproteobacteria bacterium]|nr:hypothetical protein [Alphaproteobacteria bacterium]